MLPVVDILKILAESSASSWALFPLEIADAVDPLQMFAERVGLIAQFGQDHVQEVLSDAFAPYQKLAELSEPEEIPLAPEPEPPKRSYRTPQSTIDAFWYVASLNDADYLKRWLAQHPRAVTALQKLWEAKHACS